MSNINDKNPAHSEAEEDDLDDLDDYLDEFQDEILNKPYSEIEKENEQKLGKKSQESTEKNVEGNQEEPQEVDLNDLDSVMKQFEKEFPDAKQQFDALVKEMNQTEGSNGGINTDKSTSDNANNNLKDTINSTLNRLRESGSKVDKEIEEDRPDPALLSDLLGQLNLDGANGDFGDMDIAKLLTDMLDTLASKEMLYEPLKDLSVKYPKWLEEHREEVSTEEFERYTAQSTIVQAIVARFESSSYSEDSADDKSYITSKLEEMQEAGNPPPELAGDLSKAGIPGFDFDSEEAPPDFGDLEKNLDETCKQT